MRPRKILTGLAMAALLLLPASSRAAQSHSHGEEFSVRGEVLDMACYVGHGGRGADHAPCALKCARGGQPLGLLAADGTIYLLFADHADATAFNQTKELAGKSVEVRGALASRSGLKGITVHAVKSF